MVNWVKFNETLNSPSESNSQANIRSSYTSNLSSITYIRTVDIHSAKSAFGWDES